MKFQTQQLTDDLNRIMDLMAGADGGVDYIKLRVALLAFEDQAIKGDNNSQEILNIVHRFAKLIRVILKEER